MSSFFSQVVNKLQKIKQLFYAYKNKQVPSLTFAKNNYTGRSYKTHKNYKKSSSANFRNKKHLDRLKSNETIKKEINQEKIWSIDDFVVAEDPVQKRFHDFKLPVEIMRAIQSLNYRYCTPIQEQILGATLQGSDAIGKAETGTGKTAAFLITIVKQLLVHLPPSKRYLGEPRALVVAPTRELAFQIYEDVCKFTRHTKLRSIVLMGGIDVEKQIKDIDADMIDIVIGTPGRILDHVERKNLYLDLVEIFVLDEADRMLDMGFMPQIRKIERYTPHKSERQTLLFSATFTENIKELAKRWCQDPVIVDVATEQVAAKTIKQIIYLVSANAKYYLLCNLLRSEPINRVIIFVNRRDEAKHLQYKLHKKSIKSIIFSGEITQKKRIQALEDFKAGKVKILVATDVAGRGIHVDGVSHVINFNLPENVDNYIHRIGRCGRAQTTGTAISFACENDSFLLPEIETALNEKLKLVHPAANLLRDQ